jgi:type I restriction enzyme S subunit
MKKYDNYKDSGVEWIGEIPEHWKVDKLNRIFQINTGFTPSTGNNEFYDNGEHDWITIRDLKGKYVSESKTKLTDLAVEEKTIISKGSLLYSFKLSVGQMAFTTKDLFTNEAIFSISPSDNLNLNYFYYLLDRILIHNSNENIYGAKILNQELIKSAKLLVPNSEEQNQIANYLDQKTSQIDQLISQKKRFIALLQEERTAVINQAVTKGLDPTVKMKNSGIEWLGEIPEHWEVKRMNFISSKIGDGLHGTPNYVEESNFPFINGNNIGQGEIIITERTKFVSEEDYINNQKPLTSNTILMSINGTIGNLAYYKGESIMLGKSAAYINLESNVNKEFIYYYLKSEIASDYINMELSGSTIKNLSLYSINKTPIPYPPTQEQFKIVNRIKIKTGEIETIISKSQQEIELLKEYKTALISEVVTGKVDVRDVVLN